MRDINKALLMGRLGHDPELKKTNDGLSVARLSLATSRRVAKKGVEGEWEEETQWHDLVTWGKLAENCSKHLKKGAPVFVQGSIRHRKYETKSGEPRVAHEVHVEEMSWLPNHQKTPISEDVTFEEVLGA